MWRTGFEAAIRFGGKERPDCFIVSAMDIGRERRSTEKGALMHPLPLVHPAQKQHGAPFSSLHYGPPVAGHTLFSKDLESEDGMLHESGRIT